MNSSANNGISSNSMVSSLALSIVIVAALVEEKAAEF